jgi:hypothetical protein
MGDDIKPIRTEKVSAFSSLIALMGFVPLGRTKGLLSSPDE